MSAHRKSSGGLQTMSHEARGLLWSVGSLMLVEGVGTFLLVALPTGVATAASLDKAIAGTALDSLSVAFAFGGMLTWLVYKAGDVSGGHFNPAVTLALMTTDGFNKATGVCYVIAQLLGATLGSLFVALLFANQSGAHATGYGVTAPAQGFDLLGVVLVEFLGTAILMYTIARVTDTRKKPVPLAVIGLTLGLLVLVFGYVSGGAFNPARAFGPMLVSGQNGLWSAAYFAPEFIGAVAGALAYTRFTAGMTEDVPSESD